MTNQIQFTGIPWHYYFYECLYHFVIMGTLYVAVFFIGSLLLLLFSLKRLTILPKRIGHFGLFLLLFLIVGSLVNGVWSCLIYGHIYDSFDYVIDFTPFWPVTMNPDPPRVEGYGTTLTELNSIWFAFSAFTWIVTLVLYRLTLQKIKVKKSVPTIDTITNK
jgi:hypothetical protein